MKQTRIWMAALCFLTATISSLGKHLNRNRVVTNPIDLDYAFTHNHNEGREAADPTVILFGGRYYLFVSMSYGYWSSDDMQHWKFITNDILPFSNYSPAVMSYKGELYFMASYTNSLYKTSTPEDGNSWVLVTDKLRPYPDNPGRTAVDPYLFVDDDERVYLYWGCSMREPIMGVELDPDNGFQDKGEPVALIEHHEKTYGWECRGHKNETSEPSSSEGAAMLKHNGRYYLQYAGPGTEFDCYGDALYTSQSPLGPFEHHPASPFSIKPGGWMTGAGHGDTFQDKHGNWWHVATTVVCQRFLMERRIAFWPLFFTDDGGLCAITHIGDEPYVLPDSKKDWQRQSPATGWADISVGKSITASSQMEKHPAWMAADNSIRTWWSATSGNPGEWLMIDMGRKCRIDAVQPNFADEGFGRYDAQNPKSPYRYTVDTSSDGINWQTVIERSQNTDTRPHELLVLPKPVHARFVRVNNVAALSGKFSAYDLRVFGKSKERKPEAVKSFKAERGQDRRRIMLTWQKTKRATSYMVRWGIRPDELLNACKTASPELELGLLSTDQEYFFRVDALNEGGITHGKTIIKK